jgi:phosphomevalonate kinase
MSAWIATAPGKIILAGEYAVLAGAEAIVLAVDRRVRAFTMPRATRLSPFLVAARDAVVAERGSRSASAKAAARIVVDSSPLRSSGDVKLGLGSSAAATVAAIGCALAHDGPIAVDDVHRLARAAHAAAQGQKGARGSGADVAAASYGGVIGVRRGVVRGLQLPAELALIPVWTGAAADTATLVVAVEQARAAAPDAVDAAIAMIADSSAALAAATTLADAIAAIDRGAAGIAALGHAAHHDLETEAVRTLRALAARAGGAAKSTGAGGGDIAVAALPADADLAGFRAAITAAGLTPLALAVDPRGVLVEPCP